MRLVAIEMKLEQIAIPARVEELLADAQRRIAGIEQYAQPTLAAFVPSDFEQVYRALSAIESQWLTAGRRFLEWGSGLGVATCLAEIIGFDAAGIEIESRLVAMAEDLAADHGMSAQFACGSFLPAGAEPRADHLADVAWLTTTGPDGYCELELEPDDFDLIYAYPWPGEEQVIFDVFSQYAAVGSLLLTYHGQEGLRLQRKVRG
jgi:hypothetical protein